MNPVLRTRLILWGTVAGAVLLGGLTLYFALRAPVDVDYLAKRFCDCTQDSNVQSSALELANDDFRYKNGLNTCIGEEFSQQGKGLSEDDRYYYLELIQAAVAEKCPMELSKVFAPIPRAPRPQRDTIAASFPN